MTACTSSDGARPFTTALDAKATTVLEADPNIFVLETADGVAKILCDTEPLGTDPDGATKISQVTTVYVWAYCAEQLTNGARGGDMIFPAVVHVDGSGRVDIPADGDGNAADLQRLFPARFRSQTDQAPNPDQMVQVVYRRAGWPLN